MKERTEDERRKGRNEEEEDDKRKERRHGRTATEKTKVEKEINREERKSFPLLNKAIKNRELNVFYNIRTYYLLLQMSSL